MAIDPKEKLDSAVEAGRRMLHEEMPGPIEDLLAGMEKYAHIQREIVVVVVLAILAAMLTFHPFAPLVTTLLCAAYPAYRTINALRGVSNPGPGGGASHAGSEASEWLVYWLIFATYCLLDDFYWAGDEMGGSAYWVVKVALLGYCFLPQTRGAQKLEGYARDNLF